MEELQVTVRDYESQHLPGAGGSIDVVHVKWSNCPAGDYNKCKGKESFPSVAFECVTNNRRRVLGISPIQFGARSDKHIVRFDPTVELIKNNGTTTLNGSITQPMVNSKRRRESTSFVMVAICGGRV